MSNKSPISDDELEGLFGHLGQTPLALAVSGGADSMALMHLVARWAARDEVRAAWADVAPRLFGPVNENTHYWPRVTWAGLEKPGWLSDADSVEALRRASGPPRIVVLTVDHGLRKASADEARFVCDEAARLGLPCFVLRWEGEKPVTGIQEAARDARRRLLVDVLQAERGFLVDLSLSGRLRLGGFLRSLVMAHHQEDQAETFLMRLARGSGLDGLTGMRDPDHIRGQASPERPQGFDVMVRRPLLAVAKARLVATLEAYGARWVEDSSNEDERFERVRVRKALGVLGEVGLTAERIALSARRLRDAEFDFQFVMYSDELTDRRPAFWHGGLMSEFEFDARNPFFCGMYVAMRTLRQILRGHGGNARDVELAQLERLLAARVQACPSGMTLAGCKIDFLDDRGQRMRIYREGSGEGLPEIPIGPGQTVDWDGRRFAVSATRGAHSRAVVGALGMQGWVELKKAVPRLADLKWPAAAAATLPVIAVGGVVVAYPGVACVLENVKQVPPAVRTGWDAFVGPAEPMYRAQFGYVWW